MKLNREELGIIDAALETYLSHIDDEMGYKDEDDAEERSIVVRLEKCQKLSARIKNELFAREVRSSDKTWW